MRYQLSLNDGAIVLITPVTIVIVHNEENR